jgi:tetratricopeptide (TPR) repeat protein
VSVSIGVKGGLISYKLLSFSQRCILSGNAIFEYVRLMLFPFGILPQRIITYPFPASYSVKTVVAVTAIFLSVWTVRKNRWLPAAMLMFLIPIVPVLPFFQANDWLYGPRYTYLPSVAVSIMAAYGITLGLGRIRGSGRGSLYVAAFCLTAALIIFHAVITFQRIGDWKNSATMWTRIIENKPYSRAYFLRGLHYVDERQYMAAVADYSTCLEISVQEKFPEIFQINIYAHRGEALAGAGRYEEAVRDFTSAISGIPNPIYFYHRGMALKSLGKDKESEEDFRRAGNAKGQMRWIES